MAPITNTISTFVQSQVPEFIRSDPNSGFVAFLQAYYEWMEQANSGFDIVNQSKQLPSYWDVDKTSTQFIQHFINDFLPNFPNDPALNERKLIKFSREFYQKKGSANSIQFLFRVLFNKEASLYYPKTQVLRASDGKWYQPKLLRIAIDPVLTANGFNYQQLVGRQGLGSQSNASCVIESAAVAVDPSIGQTVLELYISNVNQNFLPQESLNVVFGYDSSNNALVFSERIINTLSEVDIAAPGFGGLRYRGKSAVYTGDPIVFIGGLQSSDANAQPAVGYVNATSQGAITGVVVNDGSFYYRVGGNTIITVINAAGDTTGGNANVQVTAIDVANAVTLQVAQDQIWYKQNTVLNVANYGFANANSFGANANTKISDALTFLSIQFGNITTVGVVSGGNNYTAPPTFTEQVVYWGDYTSDLQANGGNYRANTQPITDLGWVAGVRILSGGSGYSATKDKIVVPSSVGYNAAFSFAVDANGTINSVSVTNRGNGYFYFPAQLAMANSANTMNAASGSGAVLVGYLYGQGANLSSTVDQIGIIEDFYLTSRGFDYISQPRVSVRVADLVMIDPSSNLVFARGAQVFQGANTNSATYLASIDSYNVTSHVLRVYDYQGNLVQGSNLIYTVGNTNVAINTAATTPVTVYGNGQANANAIFVAGLQNQPGFYINTDGQPSADRFLQDANTYHNYSYKVIVEQALNDYKSTLLGLVHPAGMSLIGDYTVTASNTVGETLSGNVAIEPVTSGTVSSNALLGWSANSIVINSNNYNDGSYWGLGSMLVANVPISTAIAPDNISLVKQARENNTAATHVIQHNGYTITANAIYTLSVYAKPNTGANQIYIVFDNNTANGFVGNFDIVSGNSNSSVRGAGVVKSKSITNAGNGWFLCSVTGIVGPTDTNGRISIGYNSNGTSGAFQSYTGTNSNSTYLWGVSVVPGNAQPFFTNSYGIVAGSGADFTIVNTGDLICFPTGSTTQKLQVKVVTAKLNTGNLLIESNTSFFWDNVSVTSASNLITSVANVQGNIAVNDLLLINVAGNAQSAIVQNIINATALNVNTVFNSTNSNVEMIVFPSINGASYIVINQST